MVSEFWLEALLLSYVLFYDFMTLRSVLPVTFFVKELRFPNPVHLAMDICKKPRVITRKSQLFNKKRCRHLNTGHLIKGQKITHFHWKNCFKATSVEFLGMYDLDFSCSSIFHQLWAHIRYFKGKKVWSIFHPISAPFSPPGRLPNATTTPWKWFLRVPWWNTFQWDPRKPPKPLLAKKIFQAHKS